ncbi:MAG: MFS transporter, partial [Candidatus Dormibacteraceae bacterium]
MRDASAVACTVVTTAEAQPWPAPDGTGRVPRGRLLGLAWAHLLNDGAANYLPGVLPAVLVSIHEPVRAAGALVAALTIGQALQPMVGWVADRIGGRSLILAGLLLSSLGGGLRGLAHETWLLVLLLLMMGVGSALFHPQALAAVRSMLHGRSGLLTSVFLVGGELGRGLWPTAASLVVAHAGLGGLWIVGLPGVLTVPLLLWVTPRLPARPRRGARIHWRRSAWPAAILVAYRSVRSLTTYALVTFVPIMWHLRGGSLVSGASIITTMIVVGVIGNLAGGHLADRIGRLPVLMASSLAAAGLVVALVFASGAWVWLVAAPLGAALFLTASTT